MRVSLFVCTALLALGAAFAQTATPDAPVAQGLNPALDVITPPNVFSNPEFYGYSFLTHAFSREQHARDSERDWTAFTRVRQGPTGCDQTHVSASVSAIEAHNNILREFVNQQMAGDAATTTAATTTTTAVPGAPTTTTATTTAGAGTTTTTTTVSSTSVPSTTIGYELGASALKNKLNANALPLSGPLEQVWLDDKSVSGCRKADIDAASENTDETFTMRFDLDITMVSKKFDEDVTPDEYVFSERHGKVFRDDIVQPFVDYDKKLSSGINVFSGEFRAFDKAFQSYEVPSDSTPMVVGTKRSYQNIVVHFKKTNRINNAGALQTRGETGSGNGGTTFKYSKTRGCFMCFKKAHFEFQVKNVRVDNVLDPFCGQGGRPSRVIRSLFIAQQTKRFGDANTAASTLLPVTREYSFSSADALTAAACRKTLPLDNSVAQLYSGDPYGRENFWRRFGATSAVGVPSATDLETATFEGAAPVYSPMILRSAYPAAATVGWVRSDNTGMVRNALESLMSSLDAGPLVATIASCPAWLALNATASPAAPFSSPACDQPTSGSTWRNVVLVGYKWTGDVETSYFIVQESLGTAWGASGRAYLKMGRSLLHAAQLPLLRIPSAWPRPASATYSAVRNPLFNTPVEPLRLPIERFELCPLGPVGVQRGRTLAEGRVRACALATDGVGPLQAGAVPLDRRTQMLRVSTAGGLPNVGISAFSVKLSSATLARVHVMVRPRQPHEARSADSALNGAFLAMSSDWTLVSANGATLMPVFTSAASVPASRWLYIFVELATGLADNDKTWTDPTGNALPVERTPAVASGDGTAAHSPSADDSVVPNGERKRSAAAVRAARAAAPCPESGKTSESVMGSPQTSNNNNNNNNYNPYGDGGSGTGDDNNNTPVVEDPPNTDPVEPTGDATDQGDEVPPPAACTFKAQPGLCSEAAACTTLSGAADSTMPCSAAGAVCCVTARLACEVPAALVTDPPLSGQCLTSALCAAPAVATPNVEACEVISGFPLQCCAAPAGESTDAGEPLDPAAGLTDQDLPTSVTATQQTTLMEATFSIDEASSTAFRKTDSACAKKDNKLAIYLGAGIGGGCCLLLLCVGAGVALWFLLRAPPKKNQANGRDPHRDYESRDRDSRREMRRPVSRSASRTGTGRSTFDRSGGYGTHVSTGYARGDNGSSGSTGYARGGDYGAPSYPTSYHSSSGGDYDRTRF